MESSTTSQADSSQGQKCITNGCAVLLYPIKNGRFSYTPRYCKDCAQKQLIADMAEQDKKRRIAAIQRLALPPRFAHSSFENFQTEYQPTAFTIARRYADEYKAGKTKEGLFLFGLAGSGKTHLAAAIGNKLMLDEYVRFTPVPELLLQIRKSFGRSSADEHLDTLAATNLLILDDMGSEKPTEWVQETLFVLIDRRYTQFKPTIITSNYSLDELKDRLGYRISSRIAEVCRLVELRPKDYRIIKTK